MKPNQSCPVCHSQNCFKLYGLRKGQLVRCANCQLVYFTPLPTPAELEAFYNSTDYRDYYSQSEMADSTFAQQRYQQLSQKLHTSVPSLIERKGQLLDIGCGQGDLLAIAAQAGWQVTGTELSPEAISRAPRSLQNNIYKGDIVTLELPTATYDLITMYHVIEHLLNPVQSLEKVLELLRPQGVLFVETPNLGGLGARLCRNRWSNIIPPEHLLYFDAKSLRFASESAGFQQVTVFSSAPQSIASIEALPSIARATATAVYRTVPALGLGALLQAIAYKL